MTSKYNKNKKGAYEAQPSESLMFLPYVDVFFDLRLNKPMATERFFFVVITNQKLVNGDVTFTPVFISQNQWKFVRNSACHLRKNENLSIFSKKDWMQCNEKRKAMQNLTKTLNWNNIFFVHGTKKKVEGYSTYSHHDKEHGVQSHRAVLHKCLPLSLSRPFHVLLAKWFSCRQWLKWTEIALDNVINNY